MGNNIYEMVVFCGRTKVFRILNISTGSLYSMDFKTQKEAEDAIDSEKERNGKTVQRVSLGDLRIILDREQASRDNAEALERLMGGKTVKRVTLDDIHNLQGG